MANSSSSATLPSCGGIYYIRHSVQRTLQSIGDDSGHGTSTYGSSTSSQSSSAASSTSSKKNRKKLRPCLVWDIKNKTVTVLVMATFNGNNPMIKQSGDKSIVPNVSYDDLVKHLVPIFPTGLVRERRSLTIQSSNPNVNLTEHKYNSYLVLIPAVADAKTKWTNLFNGGFSSDDLEYIADLLRLLDKERTDQMIRNFANTDQPGASSSSHSTIPPTRAVNINSIRNDQNMSEDDDDDDDDESSEYIVENCDLSIHRMKIDKHDVIQKWLYLYSDNDLTYQLNEDILEADETHASIESLEVIETAENVCTTNQ